MDFLVDASLPRGTALLIRSRGHRATDVRDVGMAAAPDADIAAYSQVHNLAILSRDFDFADVRDYPPQKYAGIGVIDLPPSATASTILKLVDDFLQDSQTLQDFSGRLAIIKPGRIRLRPTP